MKNDPNNTPNYYPQDTQPPVDYGYPVNQPGYPAPQPPYDDSTMLADDNQPPYQPYGDQTMLANNDQPYQQPYYPADQPAPNEPAYYPPAYQQPLYEQPPVKKKNGSKAPLIIAICALICVIIIVGLVIYMVLNNSDPTPSHAVASKSPTICATDADGNPVTETAGEQQETSENTAAEETTGEEPKLYTSSPSVESVTSYPAKPLEAQEGHTYDASNLLKNDATCWCPKEGSGVNCWVMMNLSQQQSISGIDIINGYAGSEDQYQNNSKVTSVRIEFSDGSSVTRSVDVKSVSNRKEIQHISFDPVDTTYVKVTILSISKGKKWDDTCITYLQPAAS